MSKWLTDEKGNRIGQVKKFGNKDLITNEKGERLGYYDSRSNLTTNAKGERVGYGNQLGRFLKK